MGQARIRGSYEERKALAVDSARISRLKEIRFDRRQRRERLGRYRKTRRSSILNTATIVLGMGPVYENFIIKPYGRAR